MSPTVSPTPERAFYQQDSLIKVRGIYPNPFTDRVRVFFTLRVRATVEMLVYNVAGEPVRNLVLDGQAGVNEITWDGTNETGGRCASGVYILRVKGEGADGSRDGFWEQAAIVR